MHEKYQLSGDSSNNHLNQLRGWRYGIIKHK